MMSQDTPQVVDLTSSTFMLDGPDRVLDLVGEGTRSAILFDTQLDPLFFDLSSGTAGEVVQKAANYGLRVAVVRSTDTEHSLHFQQFAEESTRLGQFVFVDSLGEARRILESH